MQFRQFRLNLLKRLTPSRSVKKMKALVPVMLCAVVVFCFGCRDPYESETAQADKKPEATETGIFGQKTDDIGEFDPNANVKVSDGKIKKWNPLNPIGALNAYGPAVEKVSQLAITQAVNLFYAEKGRYPKDHEEFMEKIIKQNKIELPELPGDRQYQYDVENHELVIVEPIESPEKGK